jgi:hypothetical protein
MPQQQIPILRLDSLIFDVLVLLPLFLPSYNELISLSSTCRSLRGVFGIVTIGHLKAIINTPESYLQPHPHMITYYQARSLNRWARQSTENMARLSGAIHKGPTNLANLAIIHNGPLKPQDLRRFDHIHRTNIKPCAEYFAYQLITWLLFPVDIMVNETEMCRAQANWLIWCDLFAPDPLFSITTQVEGEENSTESLLSQNSLNLPPIPRYDRQAQPGLKDIPAEMACDWMRYCAPRPRPNELRYDVAFLEMIDDYLRERNEFDPWLGSGFIENLNPALDNWTTGIFYVLQNCGMDTLMQCLYLPDTELIRMPRRVRQSIQWFRSTAASEPWEHGVSMKDHRENWCAIHYSVWGKQSIGISI